MIALLVIITISAPDLGVMEQAYTNSLQYEVVQRGEVTEELADVWGAPRMAGRPQILLQPASEEPFYLRFVQVDAIDCYGAMKTFGWNATEMLVQDPDALAQTFRGNDSLFRVVGEPRSLSATSEIRAMQVIGPADEVLYLTRIPESMSDDPNVKLSSATTFVDRPFIVILGGPDMDAMRSFYRESFGFQVSKPNNGRITVLNKAHGFDIDREHPMAMARISNSFAIEIDGYPNTATTRPHRYGELPPGMAIVAFEVSSLDKFKDLLIEPPQTIETPPYNGRRVGVIQGAADELVELIESTD